jgi:hypothetical protein
MGLAHPFLRDGVDEQALRVNVLLGIGGFVELMLAWRDGLVHSTTDQVVEHLADVGAALGARFLGP